ncbi:MAG: gliding motility-associated C-terminal domain-containing protein, partial [Bacteroidota bacterium]
ETQPLRVDLPDAVLVPCDSTGVTLFPFLAGDTSGLELLWWNGSTGKTARADKPGSVWLSATNDCGQNVLATSEIQLADDAGNPLRIYVPNVFAPESSDPDNSIFRAFFGKNFAVLSYKMEIYDRWGNLMFVTSDLSEGWEGFFNDEPMNPGVYVWQFWADLKICSRTIQVYRKGDVTIVG